MKALPSILVVCLLLAADHAAAQTAEFVVVAHPSAPATTLPRATVAQMFLRGVTAWADGQRIKPVDQPGASPLRRAFSLAVLGRSVDNILAYWQQQIFSGKGVPPPEKNGDAAVLAYVAATPGAIGYVSTRAKLDGVKVLAVSGLERAD